jgi:uncharacterized membrane protein
VKHRHALAGSVVLVPSVARAAGVPGDVGALVFWYVLLAIAALIYALFGSKPLASRALALVVAAAPNAILWVGVWSVPLSSEGPRYASEIALGITPILGFCGGWWLFRRRKSNAT